MTEKIRVVVIEAGVPEIKIVDKWEHSLENLQKFVGGYIEAVRVTDNIVIWINEEGKLQELEPNFYLCNTEAKPYDVVVGDAIITGNDGLGNTTSLTADNIAEIQERFLSRVHFNMF